MPSERLSMRHIRDPPATQPLVAEAEEGASTYRAGDAVSFYLRAVPDGLWENKVTVRSTRWFRMYAPGEFIERVSPTPLLMVVAEHDHIAVTDLALKAYERALQPKRLVMTRGGHFDPYLGEFDTASRAAVEWFNLHLKHPGSA